MPKLGGHLSENAIKALSNRSIGNQYALGCKRSEETKKKMSEAKKGNKGPIGHKRSEETKKKMSNNNARYWKGKHHSEETKDKIRESTKGDKGNNWQGGKSFEIYPMDWTKTLKRSIRERDHYTCRMCGAAQEDRAFSIHHIDYNKLNCSPQNLVTLCMKCHIKTNINRQYWVKYFGR